MVFIKKKLRSVFCLFKNISRITHYTLNCRVSTICKIIFLFIIPDKFWSSSRILVEVCNKAGSVTAAARELVRYKFDLVGVQEVRCDKGGHSKAGGKIEKNAVGGACGAYGGGER